MTLRKWPGCGQSGGILRRSCDNQYRHAAVAKEALEGKTSQDTVVRIESYYPFKRCWYYVGEHRRYLPRIQGFVFKPRDDDEDLDIAKTMIRGGYGVFARLCVRTDDEVWGHDIVGERRCELQNAHRAARKADPLKGIWDGKDPVNYEPPTPTDGYRLLLHPGYYRWWRWSPAFIFREAIERSQRRLSHRSKE